MLQMHPDAFQNALAQKRSLELIQAYYDAFNRADWPAMLACLADDVAHDINQGEREVGKAAFRVFLARMQQSYQERLQSISIAANADGSRASAEYMVHGQYLRTDEGLPEATGQRYVLPGGAFFALANGKITRVSNYYNLNDWLRQIGRV
jgi:steroid delta-isomerase-like uncharacterized protein